MMTFPINNYSFSPLQISTLVGCWEATNPLGNGTLPANNSSLSTWVDSSKSGNHFAQATGGNQPTFKLAQVNGRPAIQFVSANPSSMTATSTNLPTGANARTFIHVVKYTTVATQQYLLVYGNHSSVGNLYSLGNYNGGSGSQRSFVDSESRFIIGNTALTTSPTKIINIYSGGNISTSTMSVNNTNQTLTVTSNGVLNTAAGTTLKIGDRDDISVPFNGMICAIYAFSGVLTGIPLAQMNNYILNIWGV